jgi:hypothetical protein
MALASWKAKAIHKKHTYFLRRGRIVWEVKPYLKKFGISMWFVKSLMAPRCCISIDI